ncbi:MAG: hypothetical protein LBK54_02885 [Propionibacteriaceae bacterium]|jgi:hypothetical protein|nr:hypothetical protein [Propionibacteriaceae bacterium]
MDVIIPAEPDVPRDDIAALLPGVIGSTSELGLSDSGITVTAYSPDNYYELARLHAENKYVFDNNYGLDAEFRVTYYWTS